MKLSNLILTLGLSLVVAFSLHSQSNTTREISVDNDDERIYMKYENGDLLELKIDGKLISKSDYSKYESLIAKYSKTASTPPTPSEISQNDIVIVDDENRMQSMLHENLKAYLLEIGVLKSTEYQIKLKSDYVELDGKKLDSEILNRCLAIFEETAGYKLNSRSHFKAKISPNSSSITLSIED
ncbi:MAG: hypothetical protein ACJA1A_003128 [Saprospiraceae bacterium]|jgi:hypothetical protein|tara:strand:- start:28 stop:576 length:549 start_codon:yes stop_codon:yes gene_type:complete